MVDHVWICLVDSEHFDDLSDEKFSVTGQTFVHHHGMVVWKPLVPKIDF